MSWLRSYLMRMGIGYVKFDGSEAELWREAMRHVPLSCRWFGRSVAVSELDAQFGDWLEWRSARKLVREGDRIWPFLINPWTMAMRKGYVIVRDGKPIGGVLTELS